MLDPMTPERLEEIERRFAERTMVTGDKRAIQEVVDEVRRLQARAAELEGEVKQLRRAVAYAYREAYSLGVAQGESASTCWCEDIFDEEYGNDVSALVKEMEARSDD